MSQSPRELSASGAMSAGRQTSRSQVLIGGIRGEELEIREPSKVLFEMGYSSWKGQVVRAFFRMMLAGAPILGVSEGAPSPPCDSCQVITVTGNAEYPPVTWQDRQNPARIVGVAVELLELALKDLNIRVEGRYAGPWARAQASVAQGQVDMLAGAYVTEERKRFMDYVEPPFAMDPTVIFVKKGDHFTFNTWDDLVGLRGGAPIGNSYGEKFDRFERENLNIERVPLLGQAFDKLESGRNRYVVYGLYPGLAEIEATGRRDRVSYLPNSVISEGLYFTFSRKSPCNCLWIKDHLARKIREFAKQKLPEKLMEKYLKLWKQQREQP